MAPAPVMAAGGGSWPTAQDEPPVSGAAPWPAPDGPPAHAAGAAGGGPTWRTPHGVVPGPAAPPPTPSPDAHPHPAAGGPALWRRPGEAATGPSAPAAAPWSAAPPPAPPADTWGGPGASAPGAGTWGAPPADGAWSTTPPPPPPPGWPAPAPAPVRRTFVAAPRARVGLRFYDLVLTDDALALVPIAGAAPELVGAVVGWFTVTSMLGWYLGSLWANRRNGARLARLRAVPVTAPGGPFPPVPYADIADARITRGLFGTRLRLRYPGRKSLVVVWPNRQLAGVDLAGVLGAALGPRLRVGRSGAGHKALELAGAALLALFAVLWFLGVAGILGEVRAPTAGEGTAGVEEARLACEGLERVYASLPDKTSAAPELVSAAFADYAAHMRIAAQANPARFQPAADAAAESAAMFAAPESWGPNTELELEVNARAVDAACARLPAS